MAIAPTSGAGPLSIPWALWSVLVNRHEKTKQKLRTHTTKAIGRLRVSNDCLEQEMA